MKKNLLLLFIIFGSFITNAQNNYSISGTTKALANGTKMVLESIENNTAKVIDSAIVKEGSFEMMGKFSSINIAIIRVKENEKIAMPIILEKGKITLFLDAEDMQNSKLSGTKNNNSLFSYTREAQVIAKKNEAFQKENNKRFQDAKDSNNQEEITTIMNEYNAIQNEASQLSKDFIVKNPDSFISVLLIENLLQRKSITNTEATIYLKDITKDVLKTPKAITLANALNETSKLDIGRKAPDFLGPMPNGTNLSLKESLGKVTIIDFWASWCGPCRKENPSVVAMYNELHAQGLNIIGVSLDRDQTKWIEAIEKDKLTWNHVSNLKFWQDPIAQLYNIKSIPSTWILDKNGVIVAKDLRGNDLKAKVIELLQQ